MKILRYIKEFSLTSQTFIYDLIIHLEEEGIDNDILCGKRLLEKERYFKKTKTYKKPDIIRIIVNIITGKPKYWQQNIDDYIEKITPDIIQAHFSWGLLGLLNLSNKHKNFPLIVSCHGTDILHFPHKKPFNKEKILNIAQRNNVKFTACSEFLKSKMMELGIDGNKIFVTNNMLNPLFSKYRKTDIWDKNKELVIVNNGRMVNWKGHVYLLKAFAMFLENFPNARLKLIGEGELQQDLKDLSEELGIDNKVEFLGRVEHKQVAEILQSSDIYVQTSIKDEKTNQEETFGVALLEAIAVGLPAIFTNTGGMKEVARDAIDKTAFIIEPKSAEEIAEKLVYIVNNPYIFKNAKDIYADKIAEYFSRENILNKYKEIYLK